MANAINYTPAGGRVEVSSTHDGDSVVLTVDDSGPGIPAEQREHAFERFNRLEQTQIEGVGLGLSIVLSVVELHHDRCDTARCRELLRAAGLGAERLLREAHSCSVLLLSRVEER